MSHTMRFETAAIHVGSEPDPVTGAIVPPIYQTSTFAFEDVGKPRGYLYSRLGNPTRQALEESIAHLEGGKAGFAFSSGMAAEATIMYLLEAGDHVISQDVVYGGTYRLFTEVMTRFGLEFTFVSMKDGDELEAAIRPNTRMIWIEPLSNPLLDVIDVEMVAATAGRHGLITVADNTIATPYLFRPIECGVDLVMHSTTKYLNGHCDVIGGAVVSAGDDLAGRLRFLQGALGTGASPFDCWLVLRGIKTLPGRMRQHCRNAAAVAAFLQQHPRVRRVRYPGLESHPRHDLARRLMSGFSGMVSFEIDGGLAAVNSFLHGLSVFSLAGSLGGVESLAVHPATVIHAQMPEDFRKRAGISDDLVRLSVGLENIDDLLEDLERALKG